MSTISVCVVTKNEAHNIVACLSTVTWADQIIVIDSESTDNTVELCRRFTEQVYISPWLGCGPQRAQIYQYATSEWVLLLDADERVTAQLATEIQATINSSENYSAYDIPFQSYFCGQRMRFGDWMNEHHVRLLRRTDCAIVPHLLHFGVQVNGRIGRLRHKILHYSYPNIGSVLHKLQVYSAAGAQNNLQRGKTSSFWSALGHGIFAFLRGYILRLGFLDGQRGFMLAVYNAECSYYKYLQQVELAENSTMPGIN